MSASPAIVLDDAQRDHCIVFQQPSLVIEAGEIAHVGSALDRMQAALHAGRFLAGYFSYELGYALESRLARSIPPVRNVPLLWFGVFDSPPLEMSGSEVVRRWAPSRADAGALAFEWSREDYRQPFTRALDAIAAGDVYQVNLSMRGRFRVAGDARGFYSTLRARAGAAFGAYVDDGRRQILSFSPELFFRIDAAGTISARPMKGTAPRGLDTVSDDALRIALANDPKDRAENLMIVDLIRNDLGRLAQIGSVHVQDLFAVETYPTVHQMTSTVTAKLSARCRIEALLRALFPCGSITGAPKIRSIEIIRELEASPRGVYCGAIGMFSPDGQARFNVAIRTLTIADGEGELGVGSGVVSDSRADAEYDECLLKARYFASGESG